MKYAVILPVYNEQENIPKLYSRVKRVLTSLRRTHEIIFVNDGSADRTRQMLGDLSRRDKSVRVINFSRNFGHQMAVTAGLNYSTADAVAILDADLQDPPELLPTFFAKLNEGYDVVYAIRRNRREHIHKKFAYAMFYRILHRMAHIDVPLDAGDFCVMNRRVVATLNSLPERNRFVRGLRSWVGYRQIGIPYDRQSRAAGDSKYSFTRLLKLAFDGIFSFSYMPLQSMSYIGLFSLFVSIVGSVWAIYQKFFTNNYNRVPGFATTVILVMFIGGLQLFSLGVVGEYMRRIYDEIKQRPQYIVESTIGFE